MLMVGGGKNQITNHCMVCNLEALNIDLNPLHRIDKEQNPRAECEGG